MTILNLLKASFERLMPTITYYNGSCFVQKGRTNSVALNGWSFKPGFIRARTIERNLEVIKRVMEYYESGLVVSIKPTSNGFKIRVYDSYGLHSKGEILIRESNWMVTWYLSTIHKQLVKKIIT